LCERKKIRENVTKQSDWERNHVRMNIGKVSSERERERERERENRAFGKKFEMN
jgi:hypothetical protein